MCEVISIAKLNVALEIAEYIDKKQNRKLYNYLCKLYPASFKTGLLNFMVFKMEMWLCNL